MTSKDEISFLPDHLPGLSYGEYQLNVTQTVQKLTSKIPAAFTSSLDLDLYVNGPRFSMPPNLVQATTPAKASNGQFLATLPWVCLGQSTLPWERSAIVQQNDNKSPWLAVLLFNEDETGQGKEHFSDLGQVTLNSIYRYLDIPDILDDPLFDGQEKTNCLIVDNATLKVVLPTYAELAWLAHCRVSDSNDNNHSLEKEIAVIMTNRLPTPGKKHTAYLVSLEQRYSADTNNSFNFSTIDQNHLVYFYKWEFICQSDVAFYISPAAEVKLPKLKPITPKYFPERRAFIAAIHGLSKAEQSTARSLCKMPVASFESLLGHIDSGLFQWLPPKPATDAAVKSQLAKGSVPLPQKFAQGDTVSWYHGPLLPGPLDSPEVLKLCAAKLEHPEQLYQFDTKTQIMDATYAIAFELGRTTCLSQTHFAQTLANWKQTYLHSVLQTHQVASAKLPHLAQHAGSAAPTTPAVPEKILAKFRSWALMEGLPATHLIPLPDMLPVESLRFFTIDLAWIECFISGAFQIGGLRDEIQPLRSLLTVDKLLPATTTTNSVSGFLLRSEAVSAWPGLIAESSATVHTDDKSLSVTEKLPLLRFERLSPGVLLGLFHGEVKTLDLFLHPHNLHAGFSYDGVDSSGHDVFNKTIRDLSDPTKGLGSKPVPVDSSTRRIDIATLASTVNSVLPAAQQSMNSAGFGLEMIEGVDRIRYTLNK